MTAIVRAKMFCASVLEHAPSPVTVTRFQHADGDSEDMEVWPRTYRFTATYDPDCPEDQRYATATPWAELSINVDNPAVSFDVSRYYWLDFVPVDPSDPSD